jgi:hypothetical protein
VRIIGGTAPVAVGIAIAAERAFTSRATLQEVEAGLPRDG